MDRFHLQNYIFEYLGIDETDLMDMMDDLNEIESALAEAQKDSNGS